MLTNTKYVNLFVEDCYSWKEGEKPTPYVNWCIGIIRKNTFFGVRVSLGDIPGDEEILKVRISHCSMMASTSFGNINYLFSADPNQNPRENSKLKFLSYNEVPSSILRAIDNAQKEFHIRRHLETA